MVIRDLSFPETKESQYSATSALPLGPVTDRFIAFVLDFLILSPVVSFMMASVLRNLKTVLILNSESEEAIVIWALFVVCMLGLSCLLQAVFLYFWKATPGQKFMQLQVISYPQKPASGESLSFAQCLLRPMGWWGGVALLGVPFLEILGHPLRRSFHERLSDTLVVSLKQESSDFPLAIEARYIGSTMWIFFGFGTVLALALMGKAYKAAVTEGTAGGKEVSQAFCPEVSPQKYQDQQRLDMALALYFAEEVDEACVYTEAQKAVWDSEGEFKALGQLAMGVISEDQKESKDYYNKVCASSAKSEACAISNFLDSSAKDRGNVLRRAGLGLVSSRILLMKNSLESANYISAMGLARDLEKEEILQSFLDRVVVRAAWSLNDKLKAEKSSRHPASADEEKVIQFFKKRYGIE